MTVIAATPEYNLSSGYAPPQWSKGPAMISVTQPTVSSSTDELADTSVVVAEQYTYVFDAVFTLDHSQRLEQTIHPVQTGSAISSHAYLMPARLSMDVGMSDVMASYATGQSASGTSTTPATAAPFIGAVSKSVSAYQTILKLQAARRPLTIVTRLRTYTNMMVAEISPQETAKTITGLRMRVEFAQIFAAATAATPLSARPNSTQTTGLGVVSPSSVPTTMQSQFQIPQNTPAGTQTLLDTLRSVSVPGAGSYSSSPGQQALP